MRKGGGREAHGGLESAEYEYEDFGMVPFLIAAGGGRMVGFGRTFERVLAMTFSRPQLISNACPCRYADGGAGLAALLKSPFSDRDVSDERAYSMAKPFMREILLRFQEGSKVKVKKGKWQ